MSWFIGAVQPTVVELSEQWLMAAAGLNHIVREWNILLLRGSLETLYSAAEGLYAMQSKVGGPRKHTGTHTHAHSHKRHRVNIKSKHPPQLAVPLWLLCFLDDCLYGCQVLYPHLTYAVFSPSAPHSVCVHSLFYGLLLLSNSVSCIKTITFEDLSIKPPAAQMKLFFQCQFISSVYLGRIPFSVLHEWCQS